MRAWVVRHIGAAELATTSRARWAPVFAVTFGALALALSYFGMFHAGFSGFVGFVRTSVSLLSVCTLMLPLVALTVGALAFSGEPERHHLLLAQPVSYAEVVVGRYLGLLAALAGAAVAGFGASGAIIALRAGAEGWLRYTGVIGLSVLLLAVSLGMGILVGVSSRERSRALGAAVVVWGLAVVLYDLVVIGITVMLSGDVMRPVLLTLVMANPVDLVRVLGLLTIGARASLGAPGAVLAAALQELYGQVLLPLAAALWLTLPVYLAIRQMEQQDY